ncbi:MAG TPA: D-amino-acid transaminase [Alphaproteobacteria bacterium]
MSRIAYVNGRYVPHRAATVHIEDRGYQFADGVYEVIAVAQGNFVDAEPHLDRLERSLRELRIAVPMSRRTLEMVMREVVRRNRVRDGIIYIQMTRGVAPRDHAFPAASRTQVVMTARRSRPQPAKLVEEGVSVVTLPDIRWQRCDIKSVSLLPNVLAKQQAKEAGAYEAWLVDRNGMVTEGSSTNAWIVTPDGKLVTRSIENAILAGITRAAVVDLAREAGLEVVERPFSVAEAKAAREAFLTSTTSYVMPVTRIDDQVIANGHPGNLTLALRERYQRYMAGEVPPHRSRSAAA